MWFKSADLSTSDQTGYVFFVNYRPTLIYDLARQAVETEAIDRCEEEGRRLGFYGNRLNDAIKTIVRMVLHTGGQVTDLRETDFLEMRADYRRSGRHLPSGSMQAWEILRSIGVLTESQSFNAVIDGAAEAVLLIWWTRMA